MKEVFIVGLGGVVAGLLGGLGVILWYFRLSFDAANNMMAWAISSVLAGLIMVIVGAVLQVWRSPR